MAEIIDFLKKKKERAAKGKTTPSSHPQAYDRIENPETIVVIDDEHANVNRYIAAHDIHRQLQKIFRVSITLDGCPNDGKILYDISKRLAETLNQLASEHGASSLRSLNGLVVTFSQERSEISTHGRTLLLNNDFSQNDVKELLEPFLRKPRKQ